MPRVAPIRRMLVPLAFLLSTACLRSAVADETKEKDAKAPDAEKKDDVPALVAAGKGPFTIVLELDGTLDAKDSKPIEVHTDAYAGELEAKAAPILVPTVVKPGDLLVAFDTEKLDDQIAGSTREVEIAKLSLERMKEESRRAAEESRRSLARDKVEMERAAESLEYFNKTERARRITESEMELKWIGDSVTDQVEELEQLKKMYKADDVVEETEKIVMARSERQLERSRKNFALRQQSHDRLLRVELPRELEDREHAAARATADYEKGVVVVPMELEKSRREIAKAELDLDMQTKNLAKLKQDREILDVRAPAAGLVVPGALTDGKWSGGEVIVAALRTREALKPHQVLFTLLPSPTSLVRVQVPEASILDLAVGQTAQVKLSAAPTRAVGAKLSSIGRTSADGKFEVVLDLDERDERWMPGYSCKVKLSTVMHPDAITVPEDSVVTKGDTHKVFVWVDGKSVAKDVEVGATSGDRTEILKGLEAGTKVLESPPK